jgi:DNA repair protein SbcD/Mre11
VRLPEEGALPPASLLERLRTLATPGDGGLPPLLDLAVELSAPSPTLRREVEEALGDKPFRLARLQLRYPGRADPAAPRELCCPLRELEPEEVLRLAWRARFPGEPPEPLRAAYQELVAEARAEEERP